MTTDREPTLDEACRDLSNTFIDALHIPQLVDWLSQNRAVIWLADTRVCRWLNLPADWIRTRRARTTP
jgi:hypothetical protein